MGWQDAPVVQPAATPAAQPDAAPPPPPGDSTAPAAAPEVPPVRTKPWTPLERQIVGPDAPEPGTQTAAAPAAPAWMAAPLASSTDGGASQPSTIGQDTGDIGTAAGSALAASLPVALGTLGDLRDLAKGGADLAASTLVYGIRWALGKPALTPDQTAQMRQAGNQTDLTTPLDPAPTSQQAKAALGYVPYQPQTAAGQTFDKWVRPGLEMAPMVLATGGGALLKKAAEEGLGAAVTQAGKSVATQALAPAAAAEVAGDATKGTAIEPYARAAAAIVTGAKLGGEAAVSKAAPDADALQSTAAELKAASQAKFAELRDSGMTVMPAAYDAAIDNVTRAANNSGIYPSSSPIQPIAPSMTTSAAQKALDELIASKGTPKTWDQLDQLHQQASQAAKSLDPAERRMGAIIAQKVDGLMGGLKPQDVSFNPQSPTAAPLNPADAFNTLMDARSQWRAMRNSETIANLIQQAQDRVGANYTSAGYQTALRQVFKSFKGQNAQGVSQGFRMLDPDSQAVVNGIIRGALVENMLRFTGKMHAWAGALLGHAFGGAVGGIGIPLVGAAARSASARQTFGRVNRLGGLVSGTPPQVKWSAGSAPLAPMSIFYSLAAHNAAQQAEERRQQAGSQGGNQ